MSYILFYSKGSEKLETKKLLVPGKLDLSTIFPKTNFININNDFLKQQIIIKICVKPILSGLGFVCFSVFLNFSFFSVRIDYNFCIQKAINLFPNEKAKKFKKTNIHRKPLFPSNQDNQTSSAPETSTKESLQTFL